MQKAVDLLQEAMTAPIVTVNPEPCVDVFLGDYLPPRQSDAKNYHTRARAREVQWLQHALAYATPDYRKITLEVPKLVLVTTWKNRKRMDEGNFVQACKALIDSLVGWCLKDDTIKWITPRYRQLSARVEKHQIGTRVTVFYVVSKQDCVSLVRLSS